MKVYKIVASGSTFSTNSDAGNKLEATLKFGKNVGTLGQLPDGVLCKIFACMPTEFPTIRQVCKHFNNLISGPNNTLFWTQLLKASFNTQVKDPYQAKKRLIELVESQFKSEIERIIKSDMPKEQKQDELKKLFTNESYLTIPEIMMRAILDSGTESFDKCLSLQAFIRACGNKIPGEQLHGFVTAILDSGIKSHHKSFLLAELFHTCGSKIPGDQIRFVTAILDSEIESNDKYHLLTALFKAYGNKIPGEQIHGFVTAILDSGIKSHHKSFLLAELFHTCGSKIPGDQIPAIKTAINHSNIEDTNRLELLNNLASGS